jgi:hypothetical protein
MDKQEIKEWKYKNSKVFKSGLEIDFSKAKTGSPLPVVDITQGLIKPKSTREINCTKCGRKLAEFTGDIQQISIKCHKCKTINEFKTK